MRHFAAYGCCVLLAILSCAGEVYGASWELHPGIYASYLITDNYEGAVAEKESEYIYAVGPSLALSCTTQSFQWSLVGHVARDFHRYNDEDDTTEGDVETHALVNGRNQTLDLSYNYRETQERETLDQSLGVRRIHSGALTYNRILTPAVSLSLGYNRSMEYAPAPDEDVISDGGTIGVRQQVTPRTLLDITGAYSVYHYEYSPNAQVALGSMRWLYAISPQLRMGPRLSFERHTYDEPSDPSAEASAETDADIYTAMLFMDYFFSPYTVITASAGGSWLEPEDEESQYLTSGRCDLSHNTQDNNLLAGCFYGYAYEYDSQHDYNIYKATIIDASWDHFFTPTVLSTLGCDVTWKTTAQTGIATDDEQDTRDITYRVGLTYRSSGGRGFGGISDLLSPEDSGGSDTTDSSQTTREKTAPTGAAFQLSRYVSRAGGPLITHWPQGMFEVRALYEHLQHEYDISDTTRENRYSITIEVRY